MHLHFGHTAATNQMAAINRIVMIQTNKQFILQMSNEAKTSYEPFSKSIYRVLTFSKDLKLNKENIYVNIHIYSSNESGSAEIDSFYGADCDSTRYLLLFWP